MQFYCITVLPKSRVKVHWEGRAWEEPDITSKLLALPHFHIKGKTVLKKYNINIPKCAEENIAVYTVDHRSTPFCHCVLTVSWALFFVSPVNKTTTPAASKPVSRPPTTQKKPPPGPAFNPDDILKVRLGARKGSKPPVDLPPPPPPPPPSSEPGWVPKNWIEKGMACNICIYSWTCKNYKARLKCREFFLLHCKLILWLWH